MAWFVYFNRESPLTRITALVVFLQRAFCSSTPFGAPAPPASSEKSTPMRYDLRTAYGLTPDEEGLLLCLLSGDSLAAIATAFGVSRDRVRRTLVSAVCKAVDRQQSAAARVIAP
jgi:hypothetical protein